MFCVCLKSMVCIQKMSDKAFYVCLLKEACSWSSNIVYLYALSPFPVSHLPILHGAYIGSWTSVWLPFLSKYLDALKDLLCTFGLMQFWDV